MVGITKQKDSIEINASPSCPHHSPVRPTPIPMPRSSKRQTTINGKTTPTFDSKIGGKRTNEKRRSNTDLICELTRLKTQQIYLECNQTQLRLENFPESVYSCGKNVGTPTTSSATSSARISPKSKPRGPKPDKTAPPTFTTRELINQIDLLKLELSMKLADFHMISRHEVDDLRSQVVAVREDISQPDRLQMFSVPVIRERIIRINKDLQSLRTKNAKELKELQEDYTKVESTIKVRLK